MMMMMMMMMVMVMMKIKIIYIYIYTCHVCESSAGGVFLPRVFVYRVKDQNDISGLHYCHWD